MYINKENEDADSGFEYRKVLAISNKITYIEK